ncbi:hypothetical protein Q9L58_010682, partial [Maublancomyces gigas]
KSGSNTSPTTTTDASVVILTNPNQPYQQSFNQQVRFHVKSLPTFRYGEDIDVWITEMDQLIRIWSEKVVCPHIFANCFIQGDIVRNWYAGLGTVWQQAITEDEGCWKRFSAALRSKWSISEGVRQTKADERKKNPNETYTEYIMNKIQLLRFAYPDASESSLIQKARRGLDRDADRYCREYSSIERFYDEIVRYDEGEARNEFRNASGPAQSFFGPAPNPRINRNAGQFRESNYNRDPYPNRHNEGYPRDRTPLQPQGPRPQQTNRSPAIGQGSGRRDADDRKSTIMDRMNSETRRLTRSFLDRKGIVRFLERPCDKCSTETAPKHHFRFECPKDNKSSTYSADLQMDVGTSSITASPYTSAPTSYTFSSNASTYVPVVSTSTQQYDNGFETEDEEYDSENGERSQ